MNVVIPGVDGDLTGVLLEPEGPTPKGPRPRCEADGPARFPAVIVLPEIDGFCEGTVAAARRLAAAGYVALALDLYAPYGSAPRLRNMRGHPARGSFGSTTAASSPIWPWRSPGSRPCPGVDPDRLGAVGFSVGGRYGMMMTIEPHGLRAVVALYSRPWPGAAVGPRALAPGEHVARFAAPVCAVFGAEDEMIPADQVDEFSRLFRGTPRWATRRMSFPGATSSPTRAGPVDICRNRPKKPGPSPSASSPPTWRPERGPQRR